MSSLRDRYIVSSLSKEDIVANGDYRWIEINEVTVSRGASDLYDAFDESSSYTRTVVKHRLSARVHKLAGWDRRRLVAHGLTVDEGDVLISEIPFEYESKIEVSGIVTIYRPDLTSMNDAIVISKYPADEQESSWNVIARRTT